MAKQQESIKRKYIAYPKAMQLLEDKFEATPEELAAWVFMGPKQGGLTAYLNADELDPPPEFDYILVGDFDYLSPLMACWFCVDDITSFQAVDRYITWEALIERWGERPGIQPVAFIRAKIAESRLIDIHPITGITRCSSSDKKLCPPLESGLFKLSHVKKIEAEDFSEDLSELYEDGREVDNENIDVCNMEPLADDDDSDSTKKELVNAFDPLPLSGISKMFPLDRTKENSPDKWRSYAANASRNGLIDARVLAGGGRSESTFDPWLVAEWLINKGLYARDKADRILANNLPLRSAHLKEFILP